MNNQEIKIDPQKIIIQSIRILKGNINCPDDFDTSSIHGFKTNFDVSQGTNVEEKLIRIIFTASFIAMNAAEAELNLTAEYTIEFVFAVENLDDFIVTYDKDTKDLTLRTIIGATIMSIVYSTARGIILTRTQGTIISEGIILPIIDPTTLLPSKEKSEST